MHPATETLITALMTPSAGDLADVGADLSTAVIALGRVRTRVADLRSKAQLADMLDVDVPGAFERVFQTLAAMEREIGNAESSVRNIIGVQRQLDTVAVDLQERAGAPSSG